MKGIGRLTGCVAMAGIWLVPVPGAARAPRSEGGSATEELRSLMTAALTAARQQDEAKLKEIARELMIPNYETWFKATFGEEQGAKLVAAYRANMDREEKWLPGFFEGLAKQEGELLVEDAREPRIPSGNACGQALLRFAKNDALFYRVSMQRLDHSGVRIFNTVGYFALADGAYRRLDCKALGLWPRSSAPTSRNDDIGSTYRRERDLGVLAPRRLKVGGNAQSARLLDRVEPEYPAEAREQRISGLVRLHVILDKDGTVKQIELVSGHPLLSQAAIDAVRQWRYRVTILNGEPLEIDTTIDVIFLHNNSPAPNP